MIILVLATAIPTENAPTIGDRPTDAAIADAPKKDAVTIPSMLPFAFHNLSVFTILGIIIIAPTSNTANIPSIFRIKNIISIIFGVKLPLCTMVTTTDRTAIARISSTMAAPKINFASFDCILPNSFSTVTDIAILVAVSAVAIRIDCSTSNPNIKNT